MSATSRQFRMPSKKVQQHTGQQPLISEYEDTEKNRPRGMPPLAMIKAETSKLGLPDSDAEHLYDTWLVSGFKNGRNQAVKSWKAAIRLWHRQGYFPSQKKAALEPKDSDLMSRKMLDILARSNAYRKLDVEQAAWDFKKWCGENNRPPLKTSFIKFLDSKL